MATEALKATHGVILRAVSGALAVADRPLPLFALGGFRRAIVHIAQEANLATPDGDDRVRFHLETAYGGTGFVDSTANTIGAFPGGDIAGIIPNAVGTLTTTDGTQFVVGDIIRLGVEQLLVTAIVVDVLTVLRGQNGTGVLAHVTATDIFIENVDWVEVAQITYDNTDDATAPNALVVIGSTDTAPVILDDLDEALGDNVILAAPLGDRLRLRVAVAGATLPTYNYSARVSLQN